MSKTMHRQGGKFGGRHTTTTGTGALLADAAVKCPHVTTVSIGFIVSGKGGGDRRVKIKDADHSVLLTVRAAGTVQEIRVFTKNAAETKRTIARVAKEDGVHVLFGDMRTAV